MRRARAPQGRARGIIERVDKRAFDEEFRVVLPPEYRPMLDFQRATFARAQGQIGTGFGFGLIVVIWMIGAAFLAGIRKATR